MARGRTHSEITISVLCYLRSRDRFFYDTIDFMISLNRNELEISKNIN